MSSLKDRWKAAMARLQGQPSGGVFMPDKWSQDMMDKLKENITMMGVDMAEMSKPEPVCPITRALIVQQLSDLCVKHTNVSLREIISIALQDGVKDDYELARKLEGVSEILSKRKAGETIRIATGRFQRRMLAPAVDHLQSTIDSHLLDAAVYGQAAMKIAKRDPSDGCSDPADKTGSSGG